MRRWKCVQVHRLVVLFGHFRAGLLAQLVVPLFLQFQTVAQLGDYGLIGATMLRRRTGRTKRFLAGVVIRWSRSLIRAHFGCVTDQPWDVLVRSCLVVLHDVRGSYQLLNNFRSLVLHRRLLLLLLLRWQMSTVLDVRLHLQHRGLIDDVWSVGRARRRLFYGCWWRPCSVVLRITVTKGLPAFFQVAVGGARVFLDRSACRSSVIAGNDRRMGVDRVRPDPLDVRLENGRVCLCGVQDTPRYRWHFRTLFCRVVRSGGLRTCGFVLDWDWVVIPWSGRTGVLRMSVVALVRTMKRRFLDSSNLRW